MASLRRTVEGWMSNSLYDKLGNQPNIETAWEQMKDLVGEHLLGSEFVPVPFIKSAAYYNQLFVFTKKQSCLSALGVRPPTYKVIGNLDYLVNRDLSTWTPQFDFSPWDVADGHSMYSEYNLRITSNQFGVEKFIEFKAVEAHTRGAQPPVPGAVTIHRNLLEDLKGVKYLYVITDVVLVSYVKLLVRMGNKTESFIYFRDMPIGFRYKKYKLRSDGSLVAEMHTPLRTRENEAIWLQPLPQPIPRVPTFDYMRRQYDGAIVRKRRSTLTIPTLHETPERTFRNRREEDNLNNVHIDRPIENNNAVVQARDVIQMNNFVRGNWSNPAIPQNQPPTARRSMSMEALRGSDEEEN